MSYSLGAAAAATGLNKTSILRAIKSGKISGRKDALGQWWVEPAELQRVTIPACGGAWGRLARSPILLTKPGPRVWARVLPDPMSRPRPWTAVLRGLKEWPD